MSLLWSKKIVAPRGSEKKISKPRDFFSMTLGCKVYNNTLLWNSIKILIMANLFIGIQNVENFHLCLKTVASLPFSCVTFLKSATS